MIEETHIIRGAGFVHVKKLLPSAECYSAKNHEERGKGGKESSSFPEENAINTHEQKALGKDWVKGDARGRRERKGATNAKAVDKSWMPQMLAEKLNDEKDLAFYKFVVRRLPEEIIRDALMRALDVPQRNIRRSRGALFASIVAPELKARRRTRTHSSSPAA